MLLAVGTPPKIARQGCQGLRILPQHRAVNRKKHLVFRNGVGQERENWSGWVHEATGLLITGRSIFSVI